MNKISTVLLFTLAAFLVGCEKTMTSADYGNPASDKKVLIAGTDSPFKREAVRRITEIIGTNGIFIRVSGLDALKKVSADDYSAILVVSPIHAGKIDKRAEDFISSGIAAKKTVLYYTKGTEEETKFPFLVDLRVDTVSSASIMQKAPERAQQVAALIRKKIGR